MVDSFCFNTTRDRIYAQQEESLELPAHSITSAEPFRFSKEVCDVFDDMALRSIPFYREMLLLQAHWIAKVTTRGETLYDLGCSTGSAIAASLSLLSADHKLRIIGVDSSAEMIEQAKYKIQRVHEQLRTTAGTERSTVDFHTADLVDFDLGPSAFISLNYVLQFVPVEKRLAVLTKVAQSLRKGGVLFLSEKIKFKDPLVQSLATEQYENFKFSQGYSRLEIATKKKALDGVLVSLSENENLSMLESAGFNSIHCLLRNGPFTSWVVRKI